MFRSPNCTQLLGKVRYDHDTLTNIWEILSTISIFYPRFGHVEYEFSIYPNFGNTLLNTLSQRWYTTTDPTVIRPSSDPHRQSPDSIFLTHRVRMEAFAFVPLAFSCIPDTV